MAIKEKTQSGMSYLDVQAHVGITKHMGGFAATQELLSLCHIKDAQEVLYVGSGIGVGPAYIAKTYECHVVGVDISEKMIEWSRRRVREEQVEDKVELETANVLELPFEADRFDAVICESVLAFVEDKQRAIRECVRVTRPGGYVGLNETVWTKEPSPDIVAQAHALGTEIPNIEGWQALWAESGLQNQVINIHHIGAGAEIKSRIQCIGWPWMLRAWVRVLRLYLTSRAGRQAIKEQLDTPLEVMHHIGYGLFAGRK